MSSVKAGSYVRFRHRVAGDLVDLVSSMRFAIALLVILAVASVMGTVIEQEDPYSNYVNQFGPFWADIFRGIGLYDVYSSWWFILILLFLASSVTLCVLRTSPKVIADLRSWKDRVRENGLRAHSHTFEFDVIMCVEEAAEEMRRLCSRLAYRFVTRDVRHNAVLIAAKRGALTKIGYISAHVAIVVICLGGLLDSNLPVRLEMWMFDKTPITTATTSDDDPRTHELSASNPTFRGYVSVSEGRAANAATLSQRDGSLVQDLPFSIQLNKFTIDYYSTGMPKRFASSILVIDRKTGRRVPALVEVNRPFTYDGVSIYQSSFEDGGSVVQLTAWPMYGSGAEGASLAATVGTSATLNPRIAGSAGLVVEMVDFRAMNIEDVKGGEPDGGQSPSVTHSLRQTVVGLLGSGAKSTKGADLRNLGPSIQYKVRGSDGQAREFRNYMLPIDIGGERVYLAGVRADASEPFRYLRIPADGHGSVKDWMSLRAALADPALRMEAARRFAQRSIAAANERSRARLQAKALALLDLFAGAEKVDDSLPTSPTDNGFVAIASFIRKTVEIERQDMAARAMVQMLEGMTWELLQISRVRNGETEGKFDAKDPAFVKLSLNALSDSSRYGSPVYFQLESFKQIQSAVFQVTRAPGKKIVYFGSILLVFGVFCMFYVRERRLWFLVSQVKDRTSVLVAMSSARRTLDFEREFSRTRAAVLEKFNRRAKTRGESRAVVDKDPKHRDK